MISKYVEGLKNVKGGADDFIIKSDVNVIKFCSPLKSLRYIREYDILIFQYSLSWFSIVHFLVTLILKKKLPALR